MTSVSDRAGRFLRSLERRKTSSCLKRKLFSTDGDLPFRPTSVTQGKYFSGGTPRKRGPAVPYPPDAYRVVAPVLQHAQPLDQCAKHAALVAKGSDDPAHMARPPGP